MERIGIDPRSFWRAKVEQAGLLFHTEGDLPYWNESAYYRLSAGEVDVLETATNELHEMCLAAVQHVIDHKRYAEFAIPLNAIPSIEWAWEAEPPSLYGRFDLAFNGVDPPKMLEYNADTPTALLEAAVIQWKWLEERFPEGDQFNSIWEGLVELWGELRRDRHLKGPIVHFACSDSLEDVMTISLLRDTAHEAGIQTEGLLMEQIGWDERNRFFVDMHDRRIWTIFKLYPWEWLMADNFATQALQTMSDTQWIEPIWKMILSNKAILSVLWELYPNHPYLLPAYLDGPREMTSHVRKPILGREGANVTLSDGESGEDQGYGEEGFVYQQRFDLPSFEGNHPVIGSWVIDGIARGIGIRESDGLITDNLSRFVPHLFV
ncbi:glutathionylspermidine synthase family protein [Fimbriimonas ginsengisoli]|uniref:Glutathionylspermidine synthase n=1 Tax=Fimbriimonas ginsengisoli Gsoil 348 TaxID=661478 RepID=A0A068NN01_FIMGI|nr:glutathionylspermidine synthase family protein [Fimbriimonas ginsengisoli]AIE84100.1 glutathionylspermidine synthase [Fimbriimonas ginsengisoli Gsoil 348]